MTLLWPQELKAIYAIWKQFCPRAVFFIFILVYRKQLLDDANFLLLFQRKNLVSNNLISSNLISKKNNWWTNRICRVFYKMMRLMKTQNKILNLVLNLNLKKEICCLKTYLSLLCFQSQEKPDLIFTGPKVWYVNSLPFIFRCQSFLSF